MNVNPVNVTMAVINGGGFTLPSSNPKEGPMSSVDFTIAQHDVAWPIIGKNKNLNLGLGYSFLWKVEGLILENKETYIGVAKPGSLDGNFDYGSGRFSAKHRMGLGPILDLKYVDNYEKYAIRTAVGSSLYGGAGGTYSFFQLAGFYQINDKYALTLKHTRYLKLFSNDLDEFEPEITERLGEDLRVNTNEFYFGLMINMD